MKFKLINCGIFLFLITAGFFHKTFAQPYFSFPGGFSYTINTPLNEVFDITPDGRRAAVLTPSETGPTGASQVTIIDPVTGTRLDTKVTGKGEISVKFAVLSDGIKVVAMTDDFGNKYITIYDMDQNGLLTQRAYTQLNNNPGTSINGSRICISPATRTGFVSLSSGNIRLVSFNLDTGNVLHTFITPVSEYLNIYENGARRFLVGGFNQTLVFIDYSNPSNLQEYGRVTLPGSGASFGTWQLSTAISSDGQYVFAGNGFSLLSAINTTTRQVVGSINDARYRVRQLKIFENGSTRSLVMRGLEDGNNALKGFALINAADPANLGVVNEVVYGESIFGARDFAISKDGKRLYVGEYVTNVNGKLTTYSIPALSFVREVQLPQTFEPVRLETFGIRERVLAAWLATPASRLYSIPNLSNHVSNFDSDFKTDIGIFRPSTGLWQWLQSTNNNTVSMQFGQAEDIPVPADFDGDEKTDLAIFRPGTSEWLILESSTGSTRIVQFGAGSDTPVHADYDGDGKVDIAVFKRNPNRWLILQSSNGQVRIQKFGFGRIKPVVGDFDGEGKADLAFFYNGTWQIMNSTGSTTVQQFGQPTDIPISGDFDFDGRTDIAVFVPGSATWRIQQSFAGLREVQFGQNLDLPVPADYDGDGKTDIAVFRPSNANWQILQSTNNSTRNVQFGAGTDIPLTLQR